MQNISEDRRGLPSIYQLNPNLSLCLDERSPKDVEISWVLLSEARQENAFFEKLIAEEEKNRANRLIFPEHRRRFLVSHAILHLLLAEYLHCEPSDIHFDYQKQGKPFIKGSKLSFNLSHSGDIAIFAVSMRFELGIDIEKIREDFDFFETVGLFLTPRELETLLKIPAPKRAEILFYCWTKKEAYLKGTGKGLSTNPKNIEICSVFHQSLSELLSAKRLDREDLVVDGWTIKNIPVPPGYAAHLAIRSGLYETAPIPI